MSWLVKYKPRTMDELVMDKGTKRSIMGFIVGWEEGTPIFKGMMLHSQPGLGKGSFINVLDCIDDYEVLYYNMSGMTNDMLGDVLLGVNTPAREGKMRIVVLDEVDGLKFPDSWKFSNFLWEKGRGSVRLNTAKMLYDIVVTAKCPVVLTCNDITNVPDDIMKKLLVKELKKPSISKMVKRLQDIAAGEGYEVRGVSLEFIAKHALSMRSAIHSLEKMCKGGKKKVEVIDVDYNKYEQIRRLFKGEKVNLNFKPDSNWPVMGNRMKEIVLYGEANGVSYGDLEMLNELMFDARTTPGINKLSNVFMKLVRSKNIGWKLKPFFRVVSKKKWREKKKYIIKERNKWHKSDGKKYEPQKRGNGEEEVEYDKNVVESQSAKSRGVW